ncbi:MAG: hypothetical protein LAO09_00470 [Acidobacteriia bacterium]|nr:hypothetical protein [Terriglobia bacterium]
MKRRSPFALIVFCATAALVAALASAVVFTSATVALAVARGTPASEERVALAQAEKSGEGNQAPPDAPQSRIFAGMITDDHCGARHAPDSGKSPSECVKMCIGHGSHYALVNGDKRYLLEGDSEELGKLASQRANIAGSLSGDTIRVSSVSATQ